MKETIKTIVISVLATAIVAFIAGMNYEHSINTRVENAAKAAHVTPAPQSK